MAALLALLLALLLLALLLLNRSSFGAPFYNVRSQTFPVIASSYKCPKAKASRISELMYCKQDNLMPLSNSQYPSTLHYIVKLATFPQ